MDFPIHFDTISFGLSLFVFKGSHVKIYDVFLSLKIAFIQAHCQADPDEMPPEAAHQGHQCLPKYLFICIQNEKDLCTAAT